MPGVSRVSRSAWGILAAITVSLAAFLVVAVVAHRACAGTAADHWVMSWFAEHRHSWWTPVMIVVTDASGRRTVALLALLAAAVLWWWLRSAVPALVVVATCAGAGMAGLVLKHIVGVQRPAPALQLVAKTGPAFPSGHVTYTLALVGIVAVIVGCGRSRAVRAALAAATAGVAVAVAVSRLYLGVHWMTDVVGGALLGVAAVGLGAVVYLTAQGGPARQTGQRARTARG